jgi:hypothetical protein
MTPENKPRRKEARQAQSRDDEPRHRANPAPEHSLDQAIVDLRRVHGLLGGRQPDRDRQPLKTAHGRSI